MYSENRGHLIWTLAIHDFYSQYLDSLLGFIWALIKPLALVSCYALVFSSVMSQSGGNSLTRLNYGFYIFAGMLPWFVIQESLQRGTNVFLDHHTLVRHHVIPLYFFPFHIILSATVSGLMALVVFMILKGVIYQHFTWHFLAVFFILPVQIIFCLGLTLITSTLTVFIRDIYHLTTTFLYIWLFASPILFPLETMPQGFKNWMWINPLTSLTMIYRNLILFGRFPSFIIVLHFIIFTIFSITIGVLLYRKVSKFIVDWV